MIRLLLLLSLLTGSVACHSLSSTDGDLGTVNSSVDGMFNDAVMPPFTLWDGKPLPPPQSAIGMLHIYYDPEVPSSLGGVMVDDLQVTAWVGFPRDQLGSFAEANYDPALQAGVPGKVCTGKRPNTIISVGSETVLVNPCPPPPPPCSLAQFFLSLTWREYRASEVVPMDCGPMQAVARSTSS
jgi:hypothetical protein